MLLFDTYGEIKYGRLSTDHEMPDILSKCLTGAYKAFTIFELMEIFKILKLKKKERWTIPDIIIAESIMSENCANQGSENFCSSLILPRARNYANFIKIHYFISIKENVSSDKKGLFKKKKIRVKYNSFELGGGECKPYNKFWEAPPFLSIILCI
jgi:hypothetical protein